MKKIVWLGFCIFIGFNTYGQQKSISISTDDIPNTVKFQQDGFRSVLLDRLDSLDFPFTIFINENKVFQTDFFEGMAKEIYNRPISQIYLCHDNAINAEYLDKIIAELNREGYEIVPFKDSLKDSVYSQKDNYYQKWGLS